MRALIVALLAGWLLVAPDASASCASTLVVDGHLLWGSARVPHPEWLPDREGSVSGTVPRCLEEDEEHEMTVRTFAGIPPSVAVKAQGTYYTADGALISLADHPLHRAWYWSDRRPSSRRRGPCRRAGMLAGVRAEPEPGHALVLRTARGERYVEVDARSRMVNRPAVQPVLEGQPLAVRVTRCADRLVADRIRFVGATVAPPEPIDQGVDGRTIALVAIAAAALAGGVLVLRLTR